MDNRTHRRSTNIPGIYTFWRCWNSTYRVLAAVNPVEGSQTDQYHITINN